MARIGIVRAALAGLTLFGDRPRAALGWALIAVVCGMIRQPLKFWAKASTTVGDAAQWALLGSLALALAMAAMVGAAVVRAILYADPRPARLGLGRDEAWLLVLMLQIAPAVLAFGLIFAGVSELGDSLKISWLHTGPAVLIALATSALGLMALHARFCLAASISVAQGRPRFWASWSLTRGHGWPILGALQGLMSLLFVVIQAAPAAVIYRDLVGVASDVQAAVFD